MSQTQSEKANAAALIVTDIDGIEVAAAGLAERLRLTVEIAATRSAALRLLGRRDYAIVVLDQQLAEADPEGADLLCKSAGLAIPFQISFALSGIARLEREVQAALVRRHREQQLAQSAAAASLDAELKNAVTGLLLESQLALAEPGISPRIEARLRTLAKLAEGLRARLTPMSPYGTTVGLPPALS